MIDTVLHFQVRPGAAAIFTSRFRSLIFGSSEFADDALIGKSAAKRQYCQWRSDLSMESAELELELGVHVV